MELPSCSDYISVIQTPSLIKDKRLHGIQPNFKNNKIIRFVGGFCIVFPVSINNSKKAIRCWHSSVDNAKEKMRITTNVLKNIKLPYFVDCDYIENAITTSKGSQDIVIMDWIDAKPLKVYIQENLSYPSKLELLAESFLKMMQTLHQHNISHGDLQHGNILVSDSGNISLIDYDSMFVEGLENYPDDIKGLKGYQHPSRWDNKKLSPKSDYFSELIIYLSIKAITIDPSLWSLLNIYDTDTLVFNADDIDSKGKSKIFKHLYNMNGLENLVNKLIEFLEYDSIEKLEPLHSYITPIEVSLSHKWQNSGYKKTPYKVTLDVSKITQKFKL